MTIEDNGIGFNVEEKRNSSQALKGVGLKSMFNRAHLIGASLDLSSEPGNGTRVVIKLSAWEIYSYGKVKQKDSGSGGRRSYPAKAGII